MNFEKTQTQPQENTTYRREKRKHQRSLVVAGVTVNGGCPYTGGTVHNMSPCGAAVEYPDDVTPTSEPISVGQVLNLKFKGNATMPGRVARIFEGGFATKFDFSIEH